MINHEVTESTETTENISIEEAEKLVENDIKKQNARGYAILFSVLVAGALAFFGSVFLAEQAAEVVKGSFNAEEGN